jgi:hypothetical protein
MYSLLETLAVMAFALVLWFVLFGIPALIVWAIYRKNSK